MYASLKKYNFISLITEIKQIGYRRGLVSAHRTTNNLSVYFKAIDEEKGKSFIYFLTKPNIIIFDHL